MVKIVGILEQSELQQRTCAAKAGQHKCVLLASKWKHNNIILLIFNISLFQNKVILPPTTNQTKI